MIWRHRLTVRTRALQARNTSSTLVGAAMNFRYQKALKLRFAGKSYGEINRALGIPKSTLSSWFKNFQSPWT